MKRLLKKLCPDDIKTSIHEIDYERLWRAGYRTLIFDIDNTLGEWGCDALPERVQAHLRHLDARGFALGFLSNDGGDNRPLLQAQLSPWPVVWHAAKPSTRGYQTIMNLLRSAKTQTAMIGDQLFTDIWGAKRAELYAIYVAPVNSQTDSIWAKLRRPLERWVIEKLFPREDATDKDTDER